jgi:hypothetical protein
MTTGGAVLGAFATETWRDCKHFYGNRDCFLFQLYPDVRVHRATGRDGNFMYMHSKDFHSPLEDEGALLPHGIGFGGCPEEPRLFIPESFEHCTADFLDSTFASGSLLPTDALEKFEIQSLEIWGVGGDKAIAAALRQRAEYREIHDTAIKKARTLQDKSFVATDIKTGLLISDLFQHQEQVRGRAEFSVDDEHGGYKIEH